MQPTSHKPVVRALLPRPLVDLGIVVALFGLIWWPRAIALASFVTIDEPVWLAHAVSFANGLVQHDWAMTFRLEHPGVTILWLGVAGLWQKVPDYAQRLLADPATYQQPFEQWLGAVNGLTPLALLATARWWVTLAVALALTSAYFPLRRLVGRWVAAFCLLFVAWSPMAVAFSRQLQPDGLLASLCLSALSFLLAWLYAGHRWRDLLIAGLLMGLAWLTKIPAAMLVPTGGVLLAGAGWQRFARQAATGAVAQTPRRFARQLFVAYAVWGGVATLTFFVGWPALWVDPVGSFQRIWTIMTEYAGGHANPNFFWGAVVDDPGPLFYPVAYLLRVTPATLIGLGAALVGGWRRQTLFAQPLVRRTAFGMVTFALIFLVMMTLIGKKFDRYLLPAFLALDLMAALGWVALAQWLGGVLRPTLPGQTAWRAGTVAAVTLALALIPLHTLFTARHAPYYMTYYNPLLGGAHTAERTLFVGWGEGLEEVGHWLNQQPAAAQRRVISWYATGPLSYFFKGDAISVLYGSRMPWLDADYVVLYINQIQRGIPTWSAVDYFLQQPPVYTVTRHGLTLARLYDLHALVDQLTTQMQPPVVLPVTATWPDLRLSQFQSLPTLPIGSALPIRMDWQGAIDESTKVSLRLISADGDLIAQQDTDLTAAQELRLFVPPDATPGDYTLFLLLYIDDTLAPIKSTTGEALVPLLPITVTEGAGAHSVRR